MTPLHESVIDETLRRLRSIPSYVPGIGYISDINRESHHFSYL